MEDPAVPANEVERVRALEADLRRCRAALASAERRVDGEAGRRAAARREELCAIEERLRLATESTGFGTFDFNPRTGEMVWSTDAKEHFGLPPDAQVDYGTFLRGLHPEDRDRVDQAVQAALCGENGGEYATEYRTIGLEDGKERWLDARGRVLFDDAGHPVRFIGTTSDITDRKRAEDALRESEERFRSVLENSLDAAYRRDLRTDQYDYMSPVIEAITGFTAAEFARMPFDEVMSRVHPDDRASVVAGVAEWERTGRLVVEYRFSTKDGRYVWLADYATTVFDTQGRPHYRSGVVRDVTARRQVEDALREERDRAQRYLDLAGVIFVALDGEGRIALLNRRGSQILGYAADEVMGRDWFDVALPERVRAEVRSVFARLVSGGTEVPEYFENPVCTRGGEERLVAWRNTALRDASGSIIGTLSSGEDITDRWRAEAELREAETRLRRMFASGVVGMLVADPHGGIAEANDYFLDMVGYTRDELAAGLIRWDAITPPEYREADARAVAELRERGFCTPYEKEYVRKDGSRVWVLLADTMLPGPEEQILAVVLNITQRKRAEERQNALYGIAASLSRAATSAEVAAVVTEKVRPVLGVVSASLFLMDESGDALDLVSSAGYRPGAEESFRHMPLDARTITAEAARTGLPVWRNTEAAVDREYPESRRYLPGALGARAAFPLLAEGRTVGVIGFVLGRDYRLSEDDRAFLATVSGQVAQALERARLYEAEAKARAEAQEANREKDQFVTLVSHELRNPLNAISAGLHVVRQDCPMAGRAARALEIVERNAELQARLINDLLDLSRLQRGRLDLECVPTRLDGLVASAAHAAEEQASRAGLTLTASVQPNLWVEGDPDRLQQVVMNLLTNALKFTPAGGEVRVDASEAGDGSRVRVVVEDTGIGIEPAMLGRIFQMFRQGDVGEQRQQGLGIGLALVKGLVEQHGGRAWAESDGPGKGSRFIVELPLSRTQG